MPAKDYLSAIKIKTAELDYGQDLIYKSTGFHLLDLNAMHAFLYLWNP